MATASSTGNSISAIIPAAGKSSRMRGLDKLLQPLDGEAMLRRSALQALSSHAVEVIATLRTGQCQRFAALSGLPLKIIVSELPREGMAGSVRSGIQAVSGSSEGVVILLPDMPGILAGDIDAIIGASGGGSIVRAVYGDGKEGNPVLLPRQLFAEAMKVRGDTGPREVVARNRHRVRRVALSGDRARIDLDTPEDWAKWNARSDRRKGVGAGGGT